MTGEILILLVILGAAVLFFVTGWLRVDRVAPQALMMTVILSASAGEKF